MDFELSEEQRLFQDSARKIAEKHIRPELESHDRNRPLPKEAMLRIFQVFAREGLTAPRLPVDLGGSGMRMLDYGLVFEQLPPVIANSLISHEVTVTRIGTGTEEEQRRRLLPDLIAGRKICCTGTTEPDTGSDPRGVKTRVQADGDDLVINGRKMWITNASISDVVVVTCSAGTDSNGRNLLRRVVVERAVSPYETREIECLGLRQGHLTEILFDNCRVPKQNALGSVGDAARLLTTTWNGNRPLLGLMAVNMAQRALDVAIEYAGTRRQFGRLIGSTQLIQERLADIATAVETSRLLCYKALAQIDLGRRANGLSAMAKRYATAACLQAVSLGMSVHGAMGISVELGLEELFRDARMLLIPDGTNEILALIVGRELTGLDAFRG
ncbi:MAG: acyl-CoA/acyl-ACP dehydrogenase [Betaproteobacteria bacterium]|nr:acyl-CoA/acyl-ACP dehydrogenase [Betaproteobacteria bacterium]